MKPVREIVGRAVPLDRSDVDNRPDHPERLAQARGAHRLRVGALLEWREDPAFVLTRSASGGRDTGGRTQLRHGLVARARAVGPAGLRLRRP